jgi:hypothetical protein
MIKNILKRIKSKYIQKTVTEFIKIDRHEIDDFRFVFVGELGYGLISWMPFMNYISKSKDIKFKTLGLIGSGAFFSDFSKDHFEIDCIQGDMWGVNMHKIIADKYRNFEKLVFISNKIKLEIIDIEWKFRDIHIDFKNNIHYLPLDFEIIKTHKDVLEYVVINIKSYYNWGNSAIKNFYQFSEILEIIDFYYPMKVILNNPKLPSEETNEYFEVETALKRIIDSRNNVITSDNLYKECQNIGEINVRQISLLKGAHSIFACQGGNAVLSIFCNKKTRVLMRGGFDYPDYESISYIKQVPLVIAYDTSTLLKQII